MNSDFKLWLALVLDRIAPCKMEIRPLRKNTGQNENRAVVEFWASDDPKEVIAFCETHMDKELYFGVLGREGSAGGKANIRQAYCLWADIDFKELAGGKYLLDAQGKPKENPNWNETEARLEADGIVATFDHPPTLIIASGGGYHLYWFLETPTTDLDRVERILRGLAPRLKSDPKVAQVAAVLRPPGTMNFKYNPPREVKAVDFDITRTYTLDDFKEWELPEEPKHEDTPLDEDEKRLDVRRWAKHYKLPIVRIKRAGAATLYCLKKCPFAEDHTTGETEGESSIGQQPDGTLFFQCFHSHCVDKKWSDVRAKISGTDDLTQFCGRDLRPMIEGYISTLTGETSIGAMMTWLDIRSMTERQETMAILTEMAAKRDVVWTGRKHGVFRPVDRNPRIMHLGGIKRDPSRIRLPLDLHTIVHLYPKNVIIVAGEKDAGKTSFAMNTAYMNRETLPVKYLNSEMGEEELEARLLLFPDARLSEWRKITWIEQSSKFEDAIDPDGLNIIDFLEIGSDAYAVVEDIKAVFDRLNKGLLLIVMQKRSYKEHAVGGEGTLEKARLAINLEHRSSVGNVCRITVAKNWTGKIMHPRGWECEYKIFNGGKMEMTNKGWCDPIAEEALHDQDTGSTRGFKGKKGGKQPVSTAGVSELVHEP